MFTAVQFDGKEIVSGLSEVHERKLARFLTAAGLRRKRNLLATKALSGGERGLSFACGSDRCRWALLKDRERMMVGNPAVSIS